MARPRKMPTMNLRGRYRVAGPTTSRHEQLKVPLDICTQSAGPVKFT